MCDVGYTNPSSFGLSPLIKLKGIFGNLKILLSNKINVLIIDIPHSTQKSVIGLEIMTYITSVWPIFILQKK